MKYSNTVEYNIKTSLDSKGLTQLKSELQGLELKLQNMGNKGFLDEKTFVDARNQIQGLGQALSDAFNPSLGMLDLSKLNQELKNNDVTAQGLKTAFSSLGAEGQVAFNNLVGELGKLDTGILRTNSQMDKLFTTFSNTFRWGLVSSFFSQFMNAIHSSVDYVKELDDSLTQIMLVTDYNRDSMNEFAKSANEAAKAVSMTTTGMTNASLIFAQQGYDLGQSQELATLSAKVANASQQDTATTSDQITAYMNAYGLENNIAELTQAMDNWALIANVSAADVGELAQASQRAASMANAVGVSGEQLASQIATIESVTREAPEQIGNGLKTLYARFSDIAAGGEDEDGFTLGKVTSQLQAIGVQIFDQMGQIRDVGDIMEDLMVIWDDLDQTSKVAASQALAGKYQVNRFMALMDNSDMYEEYKGATGANAAGTLDIMNEEYAQSIEGRSAKLQASLEGLFSTIFNTDDIYPWMDAAQGAVDLLQQFFDALGGGKTVLLGISSLLMQVFSKNMAQEINNAATNRAVQQQKLENLQNSQAALTTLGAANPNPNDANSQNILNFAQYMQANAKNFNAEQMDQANSILQELVQNSNAATMAADKLKESLSVIGTGITATTGESILAPFLDSEGAVNATLLSEALQNMSQSEVAEMFSHIQDDIKPAREGLLEFNQALQGYQQELRNTNSSEDTWAEKVQILENALYNLEGKIDPDTYQRYVEAVSDIVLVTDDAGNKTAETTAEVAKLAEGLEKVAAKDLTNLDQLNKDAFQAKNTQMAAEDSNKVAGAFQEGMGSQDQIQNILNTMNAVQQLTFAWQTFQNLGSIWANEDLSKGEKVLQIIMNLTMAMPQLISAMESLKNTELFNVLGQGMTGIQQAFQSAVDKTDFGKGIIDAKEQLEELKNASEKGKEALEKIGQISSLDDLTDDLIKAAKEGEIADAALATIGPTLETSAAAGTGALGVLKGGLAAVGTAAKAALVEFWPFLLIGAVIAGVAAYIGAENEKAQKAKEEALEAFDEAQAKLEEMQALQEKVNNFQTNFETKKSEGKGFEGLADEARDLADALVEAGHASESADIRLAATKAAALGTEEAYQELADAVKTASLQAEMDTNTDVQKAAIDVLDTQKADLDEIAQKQATLRDLKEQLNNLDQEDSRRGVLENRIKELEDYISKNQEAVEAANQLREAQAANVGLQLSQETSDTVHSSGIDDATKRAGTYQEYAGTYDYDTLSAIYSENVADWDKYSELEKIDIMLHTLQDDAQIAAVEIEQILQSNSSLKDMGYAGQVGPTAEEQRNNITGALENTGLSAEQNLQLMATFDKDATYNEIMDGIREVQQGLEEGEDFDVLLKAKFDPEQIKEGVKTAIDAYQPTDEDVDADQFKSMANYIEDADASAFEEGGALEDISPDIQNNAEALEQLVEGILRYDDAISTLSEKEEDWRNALSDDADLVDRVEAIGELKETYSDFLDLGADVSNSFAENAHNLDLMAEAAAGDADAYNELLAAASEDIAVNVYGVDESSQALQDMSNYLQSDAFQDVEVGMAIEDQAFYDALNKMSADAGWTAADMEAYLSDIGCSIDPSGFEETANSLVEAADQTGKAEAENLEVSTTTEVESDTATQNDTTEYTSAIANVTHETGTSILPATAGNLGTLSGGQQPTPVEIPYDIPSVEYTAVPITKTDIQEKTGYSVNTKAEQGSGGTGGVQVKKGSVKKNNSGGAKNNHSSGGGGGGGKGGSCFIAGTLVTTLTGFSPIEQIKQGDVVLSYNELSHQLEYSIVVQTMIHDVVEPIYTLHIKNEQLRVTGIHRFLISKNIFHLTPQWIPAADLQVGDWMFLADGTWHLIHNIEINVEHQIVYNFEVAGNHNYYVGRNQILAHNKGGKSCFVAGTAISTSLGFKPIEIIKVDDIVLSYNESLHQNEYSKVVQTMIHDTIEPIYTLYIKNEQLRVTGIHRFLISKDINFEPQWITAQDLQIGDWVLLADGTWHLIWKIEINLEHQTVYNFEVSNNHNYYVGRNQILAHNKGGGGKGGKGGGGGKAKTIENKEKKEHKKDYYEEVNSQLDKTEKILSKIGKEEDRLIGDKARANQNKQLDLLEKEINLNKEKQKIQQQELKDVDALFKKKQKEARDLALKNDVRTFMPEVQYDEDGIISNYEEISKALDDMHNGLIDKYNNAAKAGNEDLTKEIDKTIKKFDDYSKEILDNAKRHNKLQSEIEETTNELEELEDKIEDVRIDAYKAHQEAIDDLKDLREDAAEINAVFRDYDDNSFLNKPSIDKTPYTDLLETFYKLDTIFNVSKEDATAFYDNLIAQEKKALDAADEYERLAIESSIAYFEEQKKKVTDEKTTNGLLGLALQDLEQLSAWRDNPDVASNPFGKNTAALSEAYEDAFKRVNDLRKQQEDLTRDARDSVLDLYDEIEDGIDRQLDGYDRLQDKLEQINDTYQLYYGEDSYENILKTMDQQSNTMQSQLDALKETYNYWVEQYQAALAVGDEKLIHEVEDRMNDAEEAMLDKAEELAEHFVDRYEKALDAGIQKMTNNLWGGGEGQMDLEDQSTMWELQKDYMDTYKDDVEKAYEIDKLRSKYIGLLNDAQGMSLQTQNKIRAQMQEQLDLLQNQKTVSEYDVKLANAKLEILQKQIALEDAQRNKNKMQLRRDTQGNYRYVYTAEQGDVQQAQDELNESQYDAYEMTKEQTIANNDRAVNLYQDYMNKIRDIANKYKDDEGARVAALAALNEEYKKLLGGLEEDFKDTTNGMYDVLTWMVENGTQDTTDAAVTMLDTLYDKNGQVKEDTGVAWRDLATQISNEVLPGIENEVIETFDSIENEADVLKDKLTGNNGVLDLIGSAAEKMNDSLEKAARTTEDLAAQTEKLFSALGSDKGALQEALNKVHEYSEGLTNAQKRTDILGSSLNKATEDLQAEKSKNLNYKTLIDLKNGIGKFEKGQKYTIKKGTRIFYDRDGATQEDETGSRSYVVPKDVEVKVRSDYLTSAIGPGLAKYPVTIYPTNEDEWGKHLPDKEGEEGIRTRQQQDWHIGITEFRDALKYDTGGYTGEWNEATPFWKNGKMAMLHQKELVLNSTDTENILSAVQLIRQLVSSNNNSLNTLKFNSNNANNMLPNSTIEQRVEIQATFPNATDADDIRMALLGLSDKAFQYAHRRI